MTSREVLVQALNGNRVSADESWAVIAEWDAREAAEARLQAATDALLGLRCETSLSGKPWSHHDGDPCWCGALSGHSPECLAARAVLVVGGDAAHE